MKPAGHRHDREHKNLDNSFTQTPQIFLKVEQYRKKKDEEIKIQRGSY